MDSWMGMVFIFVGSIPRAGRLGNGPYTECEISDWNAQNAPCWNWLCLIFFDMDKLLEFRYIDG